MSERGKIIKELFGNLKNKINESKRRREEGLLILSAAFGRTKTIRRLIENGVNINAVDEDGRTALIILSSPRYLENIILLLEAGANVNASDKDGRTALMWAAYRGATRAAQILVEAGADINIVNKDGKTALELARGFSGTTNYLLNLKNN